MSLKNNTTNLQQLLNSVNNLPEASNGVELPDLTNEGTAADLVIGKELIDGDGNKVTGTFTIDEEIINQSTLLSEQNAKIAELAEVLAGKAAGSGETSIATCDVTVTQSGLPIRNYYTTAFTESEGIFLLTNDVHGPNTPFVLQNVVCGSTITLYTYPPIIFGYAVTGGAVLINQTSEWCVFSIPQQPTGEVIITVREDD